MSRLLSLAVSGILAGGGLSPALAQKAPPASTRGTTPSNAPAAEATAAGKVLRPVPAAGRDTAARAVVTPQAVTPAPAGGEGAAFTAGLAMPPFAGGGSDAALSYAGRLAQMLDSTIVLLVATFRNTAGQPVLGAENPQMLSEVERGRWMRCRGLYWDLTTYPAALAALRRALPANPRLELAAAQLDSAFQRDSAVAECDNVASMITAPARWTPWEAQYTTAARRFYRGFYDQIRAVHERDRALVFALNAAVAPDRRIRMPAGLPPNPPYAGAAPR